MGKEKIMNGFQLYDVTVYPTRNVIVKPDGEIRIEPKAMRVLLFLASKPNQVVTRQEILDEVWSDTYTGELALSRCISLLRKALNENKQSPPFIETIPKTGYRLIAPVSNIDEVENTELQQNLSITMIDNISEQNDNSVAMLLPTKKLWHVIIVIFFVIIALAYLVLLQAESSQKQSGITTYDYENVEAVIPLAVLPFINISNEKDQDVFVDGLTEELLNSLTKIKGLKVTKRKSSFEFKEQNYELRDIGTTLNVEYVLKGSVRKSGENIRITVQLVEAITGSHILSKTFDRKLIKVFQLQEEISNQIAAALNLTLILKDDQYSSALPTLDYIAVEQLVKMRAQTRKWKESAALKAYNILLDMDKQYPNTPEIIGLLAHVTHILYWVGDDIELSLLDVAEHAKKALKLDPQNIDSLLKLSTFYNSSPQYAHLAKNVHQDMIKYYPSKVFPYQAMLDYLLKSKGNCEDIKAFLDTVPEGIFSTDEIAQNEFLVSMCLAPTLANKKIALRYNFTVNSIAFKFNTYTSGEFEYLKYSKMMDEGDQSFIGKLFMNFLRMGAFESAVKISTQINNLPPSSYLIYVYDSYLYEIELPVKPLDMITELEKKHLNATKTWHIVQMVKQADAEGKVNELKRYLNNVPEFKIGMRTVDASLGLSILQYFSGDEDLSRQTALKIFNVLTEYKAKHSESFTYWGQYRNYLALAFYSGNEEMAAKILKEDFPNKHEYWKFGYERDEFIYLPWKDHPVVVEYLRRIKQNQQGILAKYQLK